MEIGATKEEMSRKIWLIGDSYPKNWVHVLNEPLDPRHPTRHSIWTPVLEHLQERIYCDGNRRRLDINKCFICNAAAKQTPGNPPDWKWTGDSIPSRIKQFSLHMEEFHPPVVITFGAPSFRFAASALMQPDAPTGKLRAEELGRRFRAAIQMFNPASVNVFPLLHAFVARSGWQTAGRSYSEEENSNYFKYVGNALGELVLSHGKKWPIWVS